MQQVRLGCLIRSIEEETLTWLLLACLRERWCGDSSTRQGFIGPATRCQPTSSDIQQPTLIIIVRQLTLAHPPPPLQQYIVYKLFLSDKSRLKLSPSHSKSCIVVHTSIPQDWPGKFSVHRTVLPCKSMSLNYGTRDAKQLVDLNLYGLLSAKLKQALSN